MTIHQVAACCRPLTWGGLIILAGCAVGPDFRTPPPPAVDAYRKDALPPATASANVPTGDAQRFLEASDVPERRWTQFASDELNRRVEQALAHSAESLQAQATAEQSASSSLELARFQYRNGAASYLQVLDATRQYQQARIGLIQARAARLADTAALYAALGGGWREYDAREVASTSPFGE